MAVKGLRLAVFGFREPVEAHPFIPPAKFGQMKDERTGYPFAPKGWIDEKILHVRDGLDMPRNRMDDIVDQSCQLPIKTRDQSLDRRCGIKKPPPSFVGNHFVFMAQIIGVPKALPRLPIGGTDVVDDCLSL